MSLVVLGFGQIGQRLCQQAINIGINVIAVADSSKAILSQNITNDILSEMILFKKKNKLADWRGQTEQVLSLHDLCDQLPEDCVVADCSATDDTTKYLMSMQQKNIPIALANKKPLTSNEYSEFVSMTKDRDLIRFESTVGAGLPVITSLHRLLDSGDTILNVQGYRVCMHTTPKTSKAKFNMIRSIIWNFGIYFIGVAVWKSDIE